jgi:hypothetical protein
MWVLCALVLGSSIFRIIWVVWKVVAVWSDGISLAVERLGSSKMSYLELEVVGFLHCKAFVVRAWCLSKKGIFFWHDLWASVACS